MTYYEKNKERLKKKQLEYYYQNRDKILKYQIERIEKLRLINPEFNKLRKLREKTQNAIKDLSKFSCAKCGSKVDLQRHHINYEDHLAVIILCRKHHNELHQERKTNLL